jgi:SHS2 domain-containing protein
MAYNVTPFDHTADRGITVRADSLTELFAGAAVGMFAGMYELAGLQADREREVVVTGSDIESLIHAWLQELIFLFEVEEEIYTEVQIYELTDTNLRATVRGQSLDAGGTTGGPVVRIGAAVKAVTYHGLNVRRLNGGWEATLLFDV